MLSLTPLPGIPLIRQGDNLTDIILHALDKNNIPLEENDILVCAQKIVSKAEGRAVNLACVNPSQRALDLATQTEKDPRLVELILQESNEVLRTRPGTIVVEHRLGFVCANAGIDHSNVAGAGNQDEEWVLLLPTDPDRSAEMIRKEIETRTGKQVGILIIDSHGRAWRNGTVGAAIEPRGCRAFRICVASPICSSLRCGLRKSVWQMNSPRRHPWLWDKRLRAHRLSTCAGFPILSAKVR